MLTSLEKQSGGAEVVVVDDGSVDHTAAILAEAAERLPLTAVRHEMPRGRAAASNAGAKIARGEVLLFLDGDTLAGPDLLRTHAALHEREANIIARGELRHLRCTRPLRDPEIGTPWPDQMDAVARLPDAEMRAMLVTREQILDDFDAIHRRGAPGIYPGGGPRRLHEIEWEALTRLPECSVLWAAASGSNLSVRRKDFLALGGLDERIDQNDHREMPLRLTQRGARMVPAANAFTYHMTHRSGWRDPLEDFNWEEAFLDRHPIPAVALLIVFWASLGYAARIPEPYRIVSLPELEQAALGRKGLDYDVARACLGRPSLGADFWREKPSRGSRGA